MKSENISNHAAHALKLNLAHAATVLLRRRLTLFRTYVTVSLVTWRGISKTEMWWHTLFSLSGIR